MNAYFEKMAEENKYALLDVVDKKKRRHLRPQLHEAEHLGRDGPTNDP